MLKKVITLIQCWRYHLAYAKRLWIHPLSQIVKCDNGKILFDEGLELYQNVRLECSGNGVLHLYKNSNFNCGTRIECMNSVEIGEEVITAPYVYISDRNLRYDDVSRYISQQGLQLWGGVKIGSVHG